MRLSGVFLKSSVMALCMVFSMTAVVPDADAATKKNKQKHSQKQKKSKAAGYSGGPKAEIVIDGETGRVLFESNADERREPASLTKMMTAIIAFDALNAGKITRHEKLPLASAAKVAANGAVTLRLPAGTMISVDNLLEAVAVRSAADATLTLAQAVSGSEDKFIDAMNAKAREIGTTNTNFANPHGMPDKKQYSTAHDMALILKYMIKNYPKEYGYFGETSFTIDGKLYPGHNALLVNYKCKNALGLDYRCMEAGKTGFFRAAGFGLASSAAHDGYRVITVVLGESSSAKRNAKVAALSDKGFAKLADDGAPRNAKMPLHFPSLTTPPLIPEGPEDFRDETTPAPNFR